MNKAAWQTTAGIMTMVVAMATAVAEEPLPDAPPVPNVQVLPLPDDEASFEHAGRELTRFHYSPTQERAFWYPIAGPAGRSLTRMGHPHAPVSHSHHNSVWITHHNVNGVNFWADRGENLGRIVHRFNLDFADGDDAASMTTEHEWMDADGEVQLIDRRRAEVRPLEGDDWLFVIDLELHAPDGRPATIGESAFGLIGVRMAKTIGVHDGNGRLINAAGDQGEEDIFRKSTRWVDYAGRVVGDQFGGITLMDHPDNPNHPAPFHVRADGWMGVCLTLDEAITVEPDAPLRLRYGLYVHGDVPPIEQIDAIWRKFAELEITELESRRR